MTRLQDLEYFRDLFCQSKLNLLVSELEKKELADGPFESHINTILLRSVAYYELNRVDEAVECLKLFLHNKECDSENEALFLYAHGRLSYAMGDVNRAEECFLEMLELAHSKEMLFKALLGLGNIIYSKVSWGKTDISKIEPILFDLQQSLPDSRREFEINLEIFKGNVERVWGRKNIDDVSIHFHNALSAASEEGWNYFMCHSIYGIASTYEKFDMYEKMECSLTVLKSIVNKHELVAFAAKVNEKFKKYGEQIALPVQFDGVTHRIKFDQDWVYLHNKPFLYYFLEKIYSSSSFVSKTDLADVLWPNQPYKADKHDARIFDVARRAKGLIKKHQVNMVVLSSRNGYKLVNKNNLTQ